MKGWHDHDGGKQPARTAGKRVVVQLRDGRVSGKVPVTSTSSPGWNADHSRWIWDQPGDATRAFDIVRYMIL